MHHTRLLRYVLSHKKIATVALPNRPADNEAEGSGAAGSWTGQNQNRRRPSDLTGRDAFGARAGSSGSAPGPGQVSRYTMIYLLISLYTIFKNAMISVEHCIISEYDYMISEYDYMISEYNHVIPYKLIDISHDIM
jgi:hypothetical protein